jgi:hypothetical protein
MIKAVIHTADIHIRTYRLHDEYKEVFTKLNELQEAFERHSHGA